MPPGMVMTVHNLAFQGVFGNWVPAAKCAIEGDAEVRAEVARHTAKTEELPRRCLTEVFGQVETEIF